MYWQIAIKLNDPMTIEYVFFKCTDQFVTKNQQERSISYRAFRAVRRQMAFMLARQQVFIDIDAPKGWYAGDIEDDEKEILRELMSNVRLDSLPRLRAW